MNISNIKKEFPIFDNKVHNNDLVYLDSANSSQKPRVVVDRIYDFYTKEFSNVGRSVHYLAVAATNLYENTRTSVQKFINAKDANEIVFTKGATEAINLVASTFGQNHLKEGDEVLLTELEHHSNYVPWHYLRKSKGIKIEFAEINEDGEVTLESIEKKITPKTKIIGVTHLSNVTGAILPIKEIVQLAHSKNIPVLVDGCQGAPHLKLDMQDLDCDFYAISCHKMYGPTGLGILYAKKKWLEELPPYQGGGDMIKSVTFEKTVYNDIPNRFEAGTPNISGVIGLASAIKYLTEIGMDCIYEYEKGLLDYATQEIKKIEKVKIIGNSSDKASVLSFVIDSIHPHDIGTIMDKHGVAIRTGHHCTQPIMDFYEIPATARASFGVYNTKDDIEKLGDSIKKTADIFK